ncbi:MAG: tetratricopeptide repeat protein [Rhodoferax sp.]
MHKTLRPLACALLCALAWAPASWAAEPPAAAVHPQQNEAQAVYEVLAAEISAQQGDLVTGAALMLNAAQRAPSNALFQRCVELAMMGRASAQALHCAQEWGRVLPEAPEAHRYTLQLLVGMGQLAQAPAALQRMLQTSSAADRATHLALLPHYFARVGDKGAAVALVRQALQPELASPNTGPQALSALARMHAWAEQPEQAWGLLQRAQQLDPRSDEPALAALQMGPAMAQHATALVQQRLQDQPGVPLRMAWVRRLLEGQQYERAMAELGTLTREHPQHADAWLLQGSLEMQLKQHAQAQASLERFLQLGPAAESSAPGADSAQTPRAVAEARLLLAELAEQRKDFAQAETHLDAIHSPPHMARVLARRASLAAAQGRVDEALAYLRDMPTPDADALRTRYGAQLQLLRSQERHADAYTLAQEAAQALPQDPTWPYEQAMSAEKLGRLSDMETLLRAVIARHPDYHAAYNALGYSLADRNVQLDEAYTLIRKAHDLSPQDAYIIDSLGWVEFRRGRLDAAVQHLQRAFDAMPDAEIAAHLGEVLWTQGQHEPALQVWRKGLQLNAGNATLQETLKRLKARP